MRFAQHILHLVIPRSSNRNKAKLLHVDSLLVFASFLIIFQAVISFLPKFGPSILGYAAQISPSEVVRLTNEKRAQNGLSPLTINETLSSAAYGKGRDMLEKDYWAHVAPDGTQPWAFFTTFGYSYRYAGENLARDFSNPSSAVDAWMASPTHRENILNPKYKEIGIGVIEGDLAGVDTTIIVQFFGTRYSDTVGAPVAQVQNSTSTKAPVIETPAPSIVPAIVSTPTPLPSDTNTLIGSVKPAVVSPFDTTRAVSIVVVGMLLTVFLLDNIVAMQKNVVRIGGRAFAHISFLGMILLIVTILKAGQIL